MTYVIKEHLWLSTLNLIWIFVCLFRWAHKCDIYTVSCKPPNLQYYCVFCDIFLRCLLYYILLWILTKFPVSFVSLNVAIIINVSDCNKYNEILWIVLLFLCYVFPLAAFHWYIRVVYIFSQIFQVLFLCSFILSTTRWNSMLALYHKSASLWPIPIWCYAFLQELGQSSMESQIIYG